MGSSSGNNSMEMENGTKLDELSEDCISEILSKTTPLDTCRSATISKLFHAAADSDSVWDRFLPSDYQHINSISNLPTLSKKDLFFSLCDSPILVDNRTKSFRLEKATGKKCYIVGARELSIAWQDEPHYWVWTSHPNSRFDDVACLRYVCWFDIIGRLETKILSPETKYAAYLIFKFGTNDNGFDQVFKSYVNLLRHGEDEDAVDQTSFRRINLREREYTGRRRRRNLWISRERYDGWMEIEMGEFIVPSDDGEGFIVRMQVKEVEVLNGKSGIIVEGIEVRPK